MRDTHEGASKPASAIKGAIAYGLFVIMCLEPASAVTPLPSTVTIAYANWGECDVKIMKAARDGANVIVWFAIGMVVDAHTFKPTIVGGPNLTCVANAAMELRRQNLPTHHFISVGGWNAPHPTATGGTVDEWWKAWKAYDSAAVAAGLVGGFDGLDWDLEGNDDVHSQWNSFPAADLRLVADLSVRLKAQGRLVSLVPPQSYLDATTSAFSLRVNLTARCWHSDFSYAGRSVYAALLALAPADTFDLVSLQVRHLPRSPLLP